MTEFKGNSVELQGKLHLRNNFFDLELDDNILRDFKDPVI